MPFVICQWSYPWQRLEEPCTFYGAGEDTLTADEQGRFVIEGLPSGVWWIGPIVEGWREGDDLLLPAGRATRVVLFEGAQSSEIELVVHRGLFVEGVVIGPNGEECGRPEIWALEFNPEYVEVGLGGEFRFGPLVPGEYHLYADASGYATSEEVVAQAGDRGVHLELAPATADDH